MSNDFQIGDRVRLLNLPGWLVHDLPLDEQIEMRAYINQVAVVQQIDKFGYVWIGFGVTTDHEVGARYSGHSFGVPKECLGPG